jgi:hypothetical protein
MQTISDLYGAVRQLGAYILTFENEIEDWVWVNRIWPGLYTRNQINQELCCADVKAPTSCVSFMVATSF